MALQKEIRQNNGIVTKYHRVFFIQSMINSLTSIAVLSYVDEPSRKMEGTDTPPYKAAITYEMDYKENMTVEEAYGYLKTLPEFEGAEDIGSVK